jgi:hypothetical protein
MYVTDAEYSSYASAIGITLPATSAERGIQLLKASQFIDSQENMLMGIRTERDQDYAFPRYPFVVNGWEYSSTEIPEIVKTVQIELALEINAGVDIFKATDNLPVVSKRVEGAITVQYATPQNVSTRQRQSKAMTLLNQLMGNKSMSVRLVRS